MNFPESQFQFRPIKISWKYAMKHSLEIAGMKELVPEVVEETKNIDLGQVTEGSVLEESRLGPNAMIGNEGGDFPVCTVRNPVFLLFPLG